jgi:type IV secretion system protein VirB5
MKFWQRLRQRNSNSEPTKVKAEPLPPSDPYTAARQEFNEVWGSFVTQSRNWRAIAFGVLVVAAVAVSGLAVRANQSKFIPYVVEVDKYHDPVNVALADHIDTSQNDRLIGPYLTKFLEKCRSISVDPIVAKQNVAECFALVGSGSAANAKLTETFQRNNPILLGRKQTVEVKSSTPLRITNESYQLAWHETTRDLEGKVLDDRDWKATVTIAFNPPSEEAQILLNPLGLYVVDLDWRPEMAQ